MSRYYFIEVNDSCASADELRRIDLAYGEQLVGGQQDAPVLVEDSRVAPMHATVWVQPDALFVTDLGAAGGTQVDGQVLAEGQPHPLELGNTITFGKTSFRLCQAERDDSPRPGYPPWPPPAIEEDDGPTLLDPNLPGEADPGLPAAAPTLFEVGTGPFEPPLGLQRTQSSLVELALSELPDEAQAERFMEVFATVCQRATSADDEYQLLDLLLEGLERVLAADRYFVMLGDSLKKLSLRAARFRDPEGERETASPSREFLRKTLESDDPVIAFDAQVDDRFAHRKSVQIDNVRSAISVRLGALGKTLGVLYADNQGSAGSFSQQIGRYVKTLADLASLSLLNLATRKVLDALLTKSRKEIAAKNAEIDRLAQVIVAATDSTRSMLDAGQRGPALTAQLSKLRDMAESYLLPAPADTPPPGLEPVSTAVPAPEAAPEADQGAEADAAIDAEADADDRTRMGIGLVSPTRS